METQEGTWPLTFMCVHECTPTYTPTWTQTYGNMYTHTNTEVGGRKKNQRLEIRFRNNLFTNFKVVACVSDPCIWTFYLSKFIRYPRLEVGTRTEDTLYQINQKSCSKRRETTTVPRVLQLFFIPCPIC